MSAVRLFVYGSLRRDAKGKSHPLLEAVTYLGDARVQGVLYRVDWYPGLVLSDTGWVQGELYDIPISYADGMLTSLDDYEGGGYRRRKTTVVRDGEAPEDAWVYAYTGPTHTLTPIDSGDFGTPAHRARP